MEEDLDFYQDWCFCKGIYLYGFTETSKPGYFKVVKWYKEVMQIGNQEFLITDADKVIFGYYREIYLKNNNNQIVTIEKTTL